MTQEEIDRCERAYDDQCFEEAYEQHLADIRNGKIIETADVPF